MVSTLTRMTFSRIYATMLTNPSFFLVSRSRLVHICVEISFELIDNFFLLFAECRG